MEGTWRDCRAVFPSDLEGQQGNERAALTALHRLCCLLSLAWSGAWNVRWAPTEPERIPPMVPESWPRPPRSPLPYPLEPVPQSLPAWIAPAWDLLQEDQDLASAATFWHQGVLLTTDFPSFALVAFSGCVEALSTSRAVTNLMGKDAAVGAAARFWATVSLVAPDDEVDRLRKEWRVYQRRSGTAHGRTTRGVETAVGSVFLLQFRTGTSEKPAGFDLDPNDDAHLFMLRILPTPGNAAARLLYRILGAGEP